MAYIRDAATTSSRGSNGIRHGASGMSRFSDISMLFRIPVYVNLGAIGRGVFKSGSKPNGDV